MAVMHYSTIVDGKGRYVFYTMPHVAIDAEGRIDFANGKAERGIQ